MRRSLGRAAARAEAATALRLQSALLRWPALKLARLLLFVVPIRRQSCATRNHVGSNDHHTLEYWVLAPVNPTAMHALSRELHKNEAGCRGSYPLLVVALFWFLRKAASPQRVSYFWGTRCTSRCQHKPVVHHLFVVDQSCAWRLMAASRGGS